MCFEDLVKKLSPTLRKIAYRLNYNFLSLNEEDLFQEALLRLWCDFQDNRLSDKTDSYIIQGCYFHLKNYIRKVSDKLKPVSLDAMVDDSGADLEDIVCLFPQKNYSGGIDAAILVDKIMDNGLTRREKEVFCLYMEGLTIREMGERLGVSHVRIARLKNKIKTKCEKFRTEI